MRLDLMRLWQRWTRRQTAPTAARVSLAAAAPVQRLPASHRDAALSLVSPAVVNSVAYRNREIRIPRDGVHEDLLRFSLAFIAELKRRQMPFFPHCYLRSHEEQASLYNKGVTKALPGQSPHNWGCAVDVVHFGKYWDLTEKQWAVVGAIGKEVARRLNLKVTWGGDWNFYDPAHWELADWREIAQDQRVRVTEADDGEGSFADAFRAARRAQLEVFEWRGMLYNTHLR